jgi:hypothetical protein
MIEYGSPRRAYKAQKGVAAVNGDISPLNNPVYYLNIIFLKAGYTFFSSHFFQTYQ